MLYNIIWSPKAKDTYYQILEYLAENWSPKEVNDFINRTEEVLALLQQIRLNMSDRLRQVFTKAFSKTGEFIYRVTPDAIELLLFWDNRQDQTKLKF